MRRLLPLLLLAPLLAGCLGAGEGTLVLRVSDEPNAIGDFAALVVEVDRIVLSSVDDEEGNGTGADAETGVVLQPDDATLDLTQLVGLNETVLFEGEVPAGTYRRIDLHVASATGTLRADGAEVDVAVPSGRLFLLQTFTVGEGEETSFLFDVTVHELGNGEYQLKPNATESGVKGAAGGERRADAGRDREP